MHQSANFFRRNESKLLCLGFCKIDSINCCLWPGQVAGFPDAGEGYLLEILILICILMYSIYLTA
eukprot:m.48767 g.48767  ORF g.48767 m.48767 type:complete len:65 (+) comp33927_c0_seq3:2383-2577(+)